MLNVLISSAAAKIPLILAMQDAVKRICAEGRVIAGDICCDSISRYVADDFCQLPATLDDNFADIFCVLKQRQITHVLPTRDGELLFWARHQQILAEHNINVLTSDEKGHRQCLDKLIFAQCCEGAIETTLTPANEAGARYVVKPRFGAGASQIVVDVSYEEATNFAGQISEPVFQRFVKGREISIDAWLNNDGYLKAHCYRFRELVKAGESVVTTTVALPQFDNIVRQALEQLTLRGPVVLQGIIDEQGNLHLLECNSRFGGASTLGIKAGVDSFYWSLLESNGTDVSDYPYTPASEPITQIRIATDIYQ